MISAGLKHSASFLRRELGRRIRIHHIPELHFHLRQFDCPEVPASPADRQANAVSRQTPDDESRTRRANLRWQQVDGVLLLDKPLGLSSNHALQSAHGASTTPKRPGTPARSIRWRPACCPVLWRGNQVFRRAAQCRQDAMWPRCNSASPPIRRCRRGGDGNCCPPRGLPSGRGQRLRKRYFQRAAAPCRRHPADSAHALRAQA